jgi:hypothetical protein
MTQKYLSVSLSSLLVVVVSCLPTYGADAGKPIKVTPEPTDEILANPGIGWETFHVTSRRDRSLPTWIPSTVQYIRWGWGELEPQPGRIDNALLDRVLKESHDSGQKLAFRVMCCSTTRNAPYHPAWLKQIGCKESLAVYEGTRFPIPDLDDAATLERHLDFIKRLGQRYDGHPDLDHVDLGSVGWWGEWHLSGDPGNKLPTLENRLKLVDAYLTAFKKTPLLMLIGGGECLKYATQHGAGWRADCLGDLGGFSRDWCHMKKGYPEMFQGAGIKDAWRTAPVAWETCWDMRKWVSERWPLRYIFNYALALHGSYLNNKSASLPSGDDVRPEVERFLRRLGYRLVLKDLTHPATTSPGARLDFQMRWQNVGSAPCYRPYRLAYRLTDGHGYEKVIVGKVTVNRWLPGSVEVFTEAFLREPGDLPPGEVVPVTETISMPTDLPRGLLTISLAVVGEETTVPVVRLGIKGRASDGWYPLSEVRVGR